MEKLAFWKTPEFCETKNEVKKNVGGFLQKIGNNAGVHAQKVKGNLSKMKEKISEGIKRTKGEMKAGICKLLTEGEGYAKVKEDSGGESEGEDIPHEGGKTITDQGTSQEVEINEEELLESLTCPITQEIMEDPYITKCGHAFEKTAIRQWIKKNGTCPMCQEPLHRKHLSPCFALKQIISNIAKE